MTNLFFPKSNLIHLNGGGTQLPHLLASPCICDLILFYNFVCQGQMIGWEILFLHFPHGSVYVSLPAILTFLVTLYKYICTHVGLRMCTTCMCITTELASDLDLNLLMSTASVAQWAHICFECKRSWVPSTSKMYKECYQ